MFADSSKHKCIKGVRVEVAQENPAPPPAAAGERSAHVTLIV